MQQILVAFFLILSVGADAQEENLLVADPIPLSISCIKYITGGLYNADISDVKYSEAEGILMFYSYNAVEKIFVSRGWISSKGNPSRELIKFMDDLTFVYADTLRPPADCVVENIDATFIIPLFFPHPLMGSTYGRNIFRDDPECRRMITKFYNVPGFVLMPAFTMMRTRVE